MGLVPTPRSGRRVSKMVIELIPFVTFMFNVHLFDYLHESCHEYRRTQHVPYRSPQARRDEDSAATMTRAL